MLPCLVTGREGDRDDRVWVRSFDQEICTYAHIFMKKSFENPRKAADTKVIILQKFTATAT